MVVSELAPGEFDEYYGRYIYKVSPELNLLELYEAGFKQVESFFSGIAEIKHNHSYESGKWSIKEVLQHLIDTERIFQYRFFRIARHDKTSLSGFDQAIYNAPSRAAEKEMNFLLKEFKAVRTSSLLLLESLTEEDLIQIGDSNNAPISARAAAFVVPGHEIWHMEIIKERYL